MFDVVMILIFSKMLIYDLIGIVKLGSHYGIIGFEKVTSIELEQKLGRVYNFELL